MSSMLLVDLVELLLGEPTAVLRDLSTPGGDARLATLLTDRISHLPAPARAPYQAQVAPFIHSLHCTLAENVDNQPGLARLTISVAIEKSVTVEVRRIFRPASRPGADQ